MNEPQFKIHGIERRRLKKEASELKSFIKNFWHYHQMDKDMSSFYGGTADFPMSDEMARKKFNRVSEQLKKMEEILLEPYNT